MNNDLISREALKKALEEQMNFDENCRDSVFDIIDNAPTVDRFIVTTIPVTLSDGWGHVREAYYDASRQLVFTEAITRELLIGRGINITEQTEQLRNMRGGEDS